MNEINFLNTQCLLKKQTKENIFHLVILMIVFVGKSILLMGH